MARARNIKPGFFKNEDLAECSPWARLCFIGLWVLADRAGRLEDRAKRIKGELFAYDSVDVEPLLKELARFGFIVRYEVDGRRFIQVTKFLEHQSPHYTEKESVIPPPSLPESVAHEDQKDSKKTPGVNAASRGGRYPLNPDSLNPDSPNPDSESTTVLSARAPAPDPWLPVPTDDPQEPSGKALPKQEQERGGTAALTPPPDQPPPRPSAAAQVCIALRAAGVADVNPGHPRLQTLLEAGATAAEFVGFVEKARAAAPGREFAYVLGAVEGERTRAAAAAPGLHRGPMPAGPPRTTESARDRAARKRVEAFAPDAAVKVGTFTEVVDVVARSVG